MYRFDEQRSGVQALLHQRLTDAGERMHPPGGLFVTAEGMELLAAAHSAQVRRVDSRWSYANSFELPSIRRREVDVCPALLPELGRYLRPHFVTALADPGTDGGVHVFGARAKTLPHGIHRAGHDARGRTPPPGVDCRYGPLAFIDQEHGDAIGSL